VWLCSKEADFLRGKFSWAAWDVEELMKKQDVIAKDQLVMDLSMHKVLEAGA